MDAVNADMACDFCGIDADRPQRLNQIDCMGLRIRHFGQAGRVFAKLYGYTLLVLIIFSDE